MKIILQLPGILGIISFILISCASPTIPKDCGSELNPGAVNSEGRNCFYSSYQNCDPATFKIGYQTHEGIDKHELMIVGKSEGICKVKHIAEIKYISKTYESKCSLTIGEKYGKARFQLFDCEGEETVGIV
ncbi:MAG: hypothetical protein AABX13_00240 [Nanoarchaeota archaeon]